MAEEAGLYRAGADEQAVMAGAARAPAEPSASPSASRSLPGAWRASGVLWASATTRPSLSGAGCRRTRRAARCRPWAEGLALAGVVASWARCSLQQERTPAPGGDGSAVTELGLAGGGVGWADAGALLTPRFPGPGGEARPRVRSWRCHSSFCELESWPRTCSSGRREIRSCVVRAMRTITFYSD